MWDKVNEWLRTGATGRALDCVTTGKHLQAEDLSPDDSLLLCK